MLFVADIGRALANSLFKLEYWPQLAFRKFHRLTGLLGLVWASLGRTIRVGCCWDLRNFFRIHLWSWRLSRSTLAPNHSKCSQLKSPAERQECWSAGRSDTCSLVGGGFVDVDYSISVNIQTEPPNNQCRRGLVDEDPFQLLMDKCNYTCFLLKEIIIACIK